MRTPTPQFFKKKVSEDIMDRKKYLFGIIIAQIWALVWISQDVLVKKLTFLMKIAIFEAFGHLFYNFDLSNFLVKHLY